MCHNVYNCLPNGSAKIDVNIHDNMLNIIDLDEYIGIYHTIIFTFMVFEN